MASCKVDLSDSFRQALDQMSESAQDQVAIVIRALEQNCEFKPDPEEYILDIHQYVVACDHVNPSWGWSVFWYREGNVIFVQAEPTVREPLMPKNRRKR